MGVSRKSTVVNVSPKKLYIHFLSSKTITINKSDLVLLPKGIKISTILYYKCLQCI